LPYDISALYDISARYLSVVVAAKKGWNTPRAGQERRIILKSSNQSIKYYFRMCSYTVTSLWLLASVVGLFS
jgi:hypothetical protein